MATAAAGEQDMSIPEIFRTVESYLNDDSGLQQAKKDIIEQRKKARKDKKLAPTVSEISDKNSFKSWLRKGLHGEYIYPALLQLCDCSYTESYDFLNARKWGNLPEVKNWVNMVRTNQMQELKIKNGFTKPQHDCESIDPTQPERPYIVVKGCIGAKNETEDMTCIVSERVILKASFQSHVIVVAFHGSTSKTHWSKLLRIFSLGFLGEHDDWESNAKFAGKPASDLGIDQHVLFHGGYLKNYTSVHEKLIHILRNLLLARTDISMERKRVIFTGHSKGGGMATVGGCIATHVLKADDQNTFKDVKFGIFALSSPRVFQGDVSREWAQNTMGCIKNGASRNIIRIDVEGDIVPLFPLKEWCFGACDFRHVGYSYTEKIPDLLDRMAKHHPTFKKASRWNIINNFVFVITVIQLLHYAHDFTANFMNFDSRLIIDFFNWKGRKLRIKVANRLEGTPDDDQFNPYATF